jgi:hypothetical protein
MAGFTRFAHTVDFAGTADACCADLAAQTFQELQQNIGRLSLTRSD